MKSYIIFLLDFLIVNYIDCLFTNDENKLLRPQLRLLSPVNESFQKFNYIRGINIKSGSTVHFRCEGQKKVTWKFPENIVGITYTSMGLMSLIKTECHHYMNKNLCFTEFILKNITYRHTGIYACFYIDLPQNYSDKIYLFVNDEKNLFVPYNGNTLPIISHHESTIIPCLPTNSRVNISLWKLEKNSRSKQIIPNNSVIYDPTLGFTFLKKKWSYEYNFFECIASFKDVVQKLRIKIHPPPESFHGIRPLIDSSKATNITIDSSFSLNCIIYLEINTSLVHIQWIHRIKDNNITNDQIRKYQALSTNRIVSQSSKYRIITFELLVNNITKQDEGYYYCNVSDTDGNIYSASVYIEINGQESLKSNNNDAMIFYVQNINFMSYIMIGVIIIMISILLIVLVKIYKTLTKRKRRLLQSLYYDKKIENQLNLAIPLHEQVELLSYDPRWEFPDNRLKLLQTLGENTLWRMVLAEAIGFDVNGKSQLVALKMLKTHSNYSQKKALIDELKILIHLDKHLNLVNCLGAVTKNLEKGKLMVILEYCPLGNLRQFLYDHREQFADQVSLNSGLLDLSHLSEKNYSSHTQYYLKTFFENISIQSNIIFEYCKDLDEKLKESEKLNEKVEAKLTTCDLICFALQIARGMEYLESKKLIHRDLSASNILLSHGGIVKIKCLFLPKNFHSDSFHKEEFVSFKWMAIESIRDNVFTTKSNVWSFGILLWEIFSLGSEPYSSLNINEYLFKRLLNGYRLEKPNYCPLNVYELMKRCWQIRLTERPSFNQLGDHLALILENSKLFFCREINY